MKKKFNQLAIGKQAYPFFERIFYRKISKILTFKIAKTKLSPTMINFLGFLIGLGGIVLVALDNYWLRVAGAGILIFSYILDCVDGEIARGFKMTNGFGALLDTTLDSIKESLIFFALALSYFTQTHNKYIFLYLAAVLFLQRMFGRTLPWYRMLYKENVEEIKAETLQGIPKSLRPFGFFFAEAYRSGTIWILVFLGVIANQIIATFIYFIVVILALFLFLIIQSYRHMRESDD